jgi:hypothetical protein
MRPAGRSSDSADLPALERSLRDRIRADETRFTRGQAPADSLNAG